MSDLQIAARYYDLSTAMVARSYLECRGIYAFVTDYYFVSTHWHLSYAVQAVRLMVRAEDLPTAITLLGQSSESGWETCKSCGSDDIYRGKSLLWAVLAALTVFSIDAAVNCVKQTSQRTCKSCGHKWTAEETHDSDSVRPPLLLVGSIPLADSDAVFDAVADNLGTRLSSVPDGETGVRSNWIGWQRAVFAAQDAFEEVEDRERAYQLHPPHRIRPNRSATDADFHDLGFAREAIKSYVVFEARRAAGKFAPDARFQVCLPTPFAPVYSFMAYEAQGDVYPLYEAAMLREIETMLADIPARDLLIQWDVATEISIFEALHPVPFLGGDPAPWLIETLARLGDAVPADVGLGYHLCYGSMGNRHWKEPEDLGVCVSTATAIARGVARPIDFFHMPVPVDRDDDAYFAPLDDLRISVCTTIYLGLIHVEDGTDGISRRSTAARQHHDRFGLSTECGWGRMTAEHVAALLELHHRL